MSVINRIQEASYVDCISSAVILSMFVTALLMTMSRIDWSDVDDSSSFTDILIEDVSAESLDYKIESAEYRENELDIEKYEIRNFEILINKIDLHKEIIPNVDPTDRDIYLPVIDKNVAHGKYTYTPDIVANQGYGITYIYGHRDGGHGFFNRLDELQNGDLIEIKFNDEIYVYQVTNMFIVDPSDTDIYTSVSPTPLLRIQTCENGNAQRLIVDAILK